MADSGHIQQTLVYLSRVLERMERLRPEVEQGPAQEFMDRIVKIVVYLVDRLSDVDPDLIHGDYSARMQGPAGQADHQSEQFENSKAHGHLQNVLAHLDQVLEWVHGLPTQRGFKSEEDARQRLESFRSAATEATNEASRKAEALTERFTELASGLNEQSKRTASELSATQQDVLQKLASLEAQVADVDSRSTQRMKEIDQRFDAAQAAWDSRFNTERADREKRFQERLQSVESEWQALIAGQKEEGETHNAKLADWGSSAEGIVAQIAAQGMAGSYLEEEERQRDSADLWRLVAVASFGLTVIVAFIAFGVFGFTPGSTAGELAAFYALRTAVLGPSAALAFYAIRESSLHRTRERDSKRLASQLMAIRPFLAEIPEPERAAELKSAAGRFFPGQQDPHRS